MFHMVHQEWASPEVMRDLAEDPSRNCEWGLWSPSRGSRVWLRAVGGEPVMMTATEVGGFVGAGLAGAAYVPQISHLIRARCSAGISRLAFKVWLVASVLTTARAITIHADVFIVLGGIQIVATTLIMVLAARYKDTPCPSHLPGPPMSKTATGTGSSGNEPGSWRPAGRPVAGPATPAGRGGALRADIPVRRPYSHAVTEFQATHLEGTT